MDTLQANFYMPSAQKPFGELALVKGGTSEDWLANHVKQVDTWSR